jgi:diguanylate cyclase (GGDEF)-like protein/PAS domain S-box-containing protein
MGRPFPLTSRRQPITRQASARLLVSLLLFVIALSFTAALLYNTALNKAAKESADDLMAFYQFRLTQLERDWELQTRDFKTRIEFTRYLENPRTGQINLRAFFTIQGGERRFQQLLLLGKNDQLRFALSKEGQFSNLLKKNESSGWYRDAGNGRLYRVFQESIWLGKDGAGRMLTFFPLDNALLYQLASPGVTLSARYRNEQVSSSLGSTGLESGTVKPDVVERRELHWTGELNDPLTLVIEAPVKAIFSTLELSLGAGLIPIIDALILWFVLGTWLMLQARRIKALGGAVEQFSRHQEVTASLQENIRLARQGELDEINDVAVALELMAQQAVAQRLQHVREEAQIRLWSSVFESSAEAIIITDSDANIVAVNPAFQHRTGYLPEDVLGKNPRILSSGHAQPEFYAAMWQAIKSNGYWQGEVWDSDKSGTSRPYLMTISSVHDAAGEIVNYVGYYTDISERMRTEEELKRHRDNLEELVAGRTLALEQANLKLKRQSSQLIASEADLHRAQAVARLGSWRLDASENKLSWSDETYRIFGIPMSETMTYGLFLNAVHEDDRALVDQSWQAALRGEPYNIEHRIVVAGEVKWVREQAEMVFDGQGELQGGIGTVQDITERKQMEEQVRQLAFYDALTRLPNRHLLNDRLSQTITASKRSGCYGALMFLDLDNFKPLNDTHGHIVGDLLLAEVAQRITNCVRELDTVARFGGDEFVVILNELETDRAESSAEALVVAEKIRAALSEPYLLNVRQDEKAVITVRHQCGASIGVIVFSGHQGNQDDILKWADTAMYQAKVAGRNLIRFYDSNT